MRYEIRPWDSKQSEGGYSLTLLQYWVWDKIRPWDSKQSEGGYPPTLFQSCWRDWSDVACEPPLLVRRTL